MVEKHRRPPSVSTPDDRAAVKRRKRLLRYVLVGLGLVVFSGAALYGLAVYQPTVQATGKARIFTIPKGSTVQAIGNQLEQLGLIHSGTKFARLARVLGKDTTIHSGRYQVQVGTGPKAILEILNRGETHPTWLTVPEGLTVREIAGLLTRVGLDSSRVVALAHDRAYIASLGLDVDSLEGYLFPETYRVEWNMDEQDLLKMMVNQFYQVYQEDWRSREKALGLTRHQVVTLASMIEEEAHISSEHPMIASVFYNRLKRNWRLESDPTVLYALGRHKKRVLNRDLEIDSRYNTYKYAGLPPGPICSPGRSALHAALYPPDTDYLYFVAQGDGSHFFSRTYKEHLRAKRRFQGS